MQEKEPIPRKITKYDGNGNYFEVDNPDLYNLEGDFIKPRRKPTNITPKKKKRK